MIKELDEELTQLNYMEKLAIIKPRTDEKLIFKYKKEPEKVKTHWDYLLEEMVRIFFNSL
jgi:hypothetical protein